MRRRIDSLEQLKKESAAGAEFFILLNFNLRSSKWILWDEDKKSFFVRNMIDDTEQFLTEKQIMDREFTNIGHAIGNRALFKDS